MFYMDTIFLTNYLLVVDSGSGDVAVIKNQANASPSLFTMLPAGSHPNDIVVKAFNEK